MRNLSKRPEKRLVMGLYTVICVVIFLCCLEAGIQVKGEPSLERRGEPWPAPAFLSGGSRDLFVEILNGFAWHGAEFVV